MRIFINLLTSLGFVLLFVTLPVEAHSIGRSSSYWTVTEDVTEGRWALSQSEFSALYGNDGLPVGEASILAFLNDHFEVRSMDRLCMFTDAQANLIAGSDITINYHIACPVEAVSLVKLFEKAPSHVHLAHINHLGKQTETLLTYDRAKVSLEMELQATDDWQSFIQYVKLGFLHILEGFDHLAFLMALLLVVSRVKSLFWAITGFTVGHSVTLVLGSLGVVVARPEVVEPLIAFTIAFTAVDSLIARSKAAGTLLLVGISGVVVLFVIDRWLNMQIPMIAWLGVGLLTVSVWVFSLQGEEKAVKALPFVTVGFGLIHGFGFAGVLAELGLPVAGRFEALLGFNVGVELGQLTFVSVMLLIASMAYFLPRKTNERLRIGLSLALIILGLYWFGERVYLS